LIRVTSPDTIANGVRDQREETVALKKELIANGARVQKGGDCSTIKESVRVTYHDNIANGVRVPNGGYF
jgi:hypothetical protein